MAPSGGSRPPLPQPFRVSWRERGQTRAVTSAVMPHSFCQVRRLDAGSVAKFGLLRRARTGWASSPGRGPDPVPPAHSGGGACGDNKRAGRRDLVHRAPGQQDRRDQLQRTYPPTGSRRHAISGNGSARSHMWLPAEPPRAAETAIAMGYAVDDLLPNGISTRRRRRSPCPVPWPSPFLRYQHPLDEDSTLAAAADAELKLRRTVLGRLPREGQGGHREPRQNNRADLASRNRSTTGGPLRRAIIRNLQVCAHQTHFQGYGHPAPAARAGATSTCPVRVAANSRTFSVPHHSAAMRKRPFEHRLPRL